MQPGRKGTRLEPDARDRQPGGHEPPNQVVRLGCSLAFGDDNSILVDDTDSGLGERDIQAGEILHETLPMMAGSANYRAVLPVWRP